MEVNSRFRLTPAEGGVSILDDLLDEGAGLGYMMPRLRARWDAPAKRKQAEQKATT